MLASGNTTVIPAKVGIHLAASRLRKDRQDDSEESGTDTIRIAFRPAKCRRVLAALTPLFGADYD